MSDFNFTGGHTPEPLPQQDMLPEVDIVIPEKPQEEPATEEVIDDINSSSDDVVDFTEWCNYKRPEPQAEQINTPPIEEKRPAAPRRSAKGGKGKKAAPKKGLSKGCLSFIITAAVILVASVSIAAYAVSAARDYLGINKSTVVTITVEPGMTAGEIADLLKDAGAIDNAGFFKLYSKLKGYDSIYRAGTYQFNTQIGYDGIVNQLKTGNNFKTVTIKIEETATVDEIIALFEENDICTRDEFIDAMDNGNYQYDFIKYIPMDRVRYRFEGYLYPDTYEFFTSEKKGAAKLAIDKMLNNFSSKLPDNYLELVDQLNDQYPDIITAGGESGNITFHDVMSMASIVGLEANGFPNEASNVAAVFYNRLIWDEPKYLGSTPTYKYPDNRYNTNAPDDNDKTQDGYEGLPPGPQCNPTIDSIVGALQPTKNFKATYFVTDSDMKFYYNSSYKAHLNTINKLKDQGKWDA